MSLRTFHLVFITSAIVMCVASAVLIAVLAMSETWALSGIVLSVVAAVGLVVYERAFLRRYGSVLPKM